jgi:hypothetical protein
MHGTGDPQNAGTQNAKKRAVASARLTTALLMSIAPWIAAVLDYQHAIPA